MNDLPQHSPAETTHRGLLARNIKAIALVAAGALVTKLTPAKAGEDDGGHCFLRGTKIQTVERERSIEALVAGDLLPTVFGGGAPDTVDRAVSA